jgi:hypothetical protein
VLEPKATLSNLPRAPGQTLPAGLAGPRARLPNQRVGYAREAWRSPGPFESGSWGIPRSWAVMPPLWNASYLALRPAIFTALAQS